MTYKDEKSGIEFPLNHPFAIALARHIEDDKKTERAWVSNLRKLAVKMAHPDDGWVNRETNEITPVYPQFDDGVEIGDTIALGWPGKYRLVRVLAIRRSMFGSRFLKFCSAQD